MHGPLQRLASVVVAVVIVAACSAAGVAPGSPSTAPPVVSQGGAQPAAGVIGPGTFYECVTKSMQGGAPMQQAIEACWPDLSQVSGREGLDGIFGLGGVEPAGSAEAPACSSGISNPYGADQTPHWPGHQSQDARLNFFESGADDHYASWNRLKDSQYLKDIAQEAWKTYEVYKAAWEKRYKEVFGVPPPTKETTDPPPDPGSQPGTEDVPSCEDIAAFFVECQMSGWQRADCASMQAQMNGCDMTIANPGDTAYCTKVVFSEEEVQAALELACNAAQKKPIPGEDPCSGETSGFAVVTFPTGSNGSLCRDPKAMPGEGDCLVDVTIATFGERSIGEILEEGREKAGGPVWILPQTGPPGGPHPPYLLSDIRVEVTEDAPRG